MRCAIVWCVALRKIGGEGAGRREPRGERMTGLEAVEAGDRAGFELRDRVVEALDHYRHDAELLDGALRQALARYDRTMLGDPGRRYPGAR